MTREERQLFYNELKRLFDEWVKTGDRDDLVTSEKVAELFADKYMQTITGQQDLPQVTFRQFLDELPYIVKELVSIEEIAKADIDALFDGTTEDITKEDEV